MLRQLLMVCGLLAGAAGDCVAQEAFEVSPESPRWLLGGVVGMHGRDCAKVREEAVQELLALQWTLSHWNHAARHATPHHRLALTARDSCSRPQAALREALDLVRAAQGPCLETASLLRKEKELLGLVLGGTAEETARTAAVLQSLSSLPLLAYTTAAATALQASETPLAIATAPSLSHYATAALALLQHLDSNFVLVIKSPQILPATLKDFKEQLADASVIVEKTLDFEPEDADFWSYLGASQARAVICLLDKQELLGLMTGNDRGLPDDKLWLALPVKGEVLSPNEARVLMPRASQGSLVFLQERQQPLQDFRDYFLGTLANNFHSFPLLARYMEQIHNCSLSPRAGFVGCASVSPSQMGLRYAQGWAVRGAVLGGYALGALGDVLREAPACLAGVDSEACALVGRDALRRLRYAFDDDDPAAFASQALSFSPDPKRQGFFTADGLVIEAVQGVRDRLGARLQLVLEFPTGASPKLFPSKVHWAEGVDGIQSRCPEGSPLCRGCEGGELAVDLGRLSLSLPRDYDVYVLAQLEFHEGPDCSAPVRHTDRLSPAMALLYSLWTFKDRHPRLRLLPKLSVGALVLDSCSDPSYAASVLLASRSRCLLLQYPNRNITIAPSQIVAYASLGREDTARALAPLLQGKPLLTLNEETGFSLLPPRESLLKAVLGLVEAYRWNSVSVVVSSEDKGLGRLGLELAAEAVAADLCVAETLGVEDVERSNASFAGPVVLLLTTADETLRVFQAYQRSEHHTTFVLVGDKAKHWAMHQGADEELGKLALGSIALAPADVSNPDFVEWFNSITPSRFPEPWFHRAVEEEFECSLFSERAGGVERTASEADRRECSGRERVAELPGWSRLQMSGYVAEAMETLLFAVDAAYRTTCPGLGGLCADFLRHGPPRLRHSLAGTARRQTLALHSLRRAPDGSPAYLPVGNWSAGPGLRLDRPWLSYDRTGLQSRAVPRSRCDPPLCRCDAGRRHLFASPYRQTGLADGPALDFVRPGSPSLVAMDVSESLSAERIRPGIWQSPVWAYTMLGLASVLLLASVCVLLLVCIKLYFGVVKGNQSLGLALLLGVSALFLTSFAFVLPPSEWLCALGFAAHPLVYALAFGVMLAKALQLRNQETIGEGGGYIGFWNYWLLLFFVVGLQAAVSGQWLGLHGHGQGHSHGTLSCGHTRWELVAAQAYPALLLGLLCAASLANRQVKRNYKETKWLAYTALLCLLVWLLWLPLYLLLPEGTQNSVIVLELLACGSLILGLMFGPKLYILLSYEPVMVETSSVGGWKGKTSVAEERAESPACSAVTQSTGASDSGPSSPLASPVFAPALQKKRSSKRRPSNGLPQPPTPLLHYQHHHIPR